MIVLFTADEDLDLTPFLVEQEEPTVAADVTTQTDAFSEPEPPAVYIPAKTGVDAGTQIEHGALFDFDTEVEPLLCVIVGKTLEQSLLEVMEESELEGLQVSRHELEQANEAERERLAQLEADTAKREQAKAKAMAVQRTRRRRELRTLSKVAAVAVARRICSAVTSSAVAHLAVEGRFANPDAEEIAAFVTTQLAPAATKKLQQTQAAHTAVDQLVADAVALQRRKLSQLRAEQAQAAAAAAAAAELKELKRRYLIKVTVHPPEDLLADSALQRRVVAEALGVPLPAGGSGDSDAEEDAEGGELGNVEPGSVVVGPFPVARIDTVSDVTARIHDLIDAQVARAVRRARAAAGLLEEGEGEEDGGAAAGDDDEEDEDEDGSSGSILWMTHTRLHLTYQGRKLPEDANLNEFSAEELLAGLGVGTYVTAARQ